MSTIPKFTISAYDQLIERGTFDGPDRRRIELIRGELREMSPAGPFHEDLISYVNDWSHKNATRSVQIRVQCSIGLVELESVPEPDIAWVRRARYRKRRPLAKDVLLVIEVADSSLDYDLGEKLELYAEAGIQEYWVVDIPNERVEIFRSPAKRRYRVHKSNSIGDNISPQSAPQAMLNIKDLFSE